MLILCDTLHQGSDSSGKRLVTYRLTEIGMSKNRLQLVGLFGVDVRSMQLIDDAGYYLRPFST